VQSKLLRIFIADFAVIELLPVRHSPLYQLIKAREFEMHRELGGN
jgi:hypothetical protein